MRRLIFLLLMLVGVASAQVVPGILRTASYEAPPDEGGWSYVELGGGTCTSISEAAGTLTITAAGQDIENACLVYKTIVADPSRLGAQVYGNIATLTGTAAATAKTGAIIANNATNTAAMCTAWWNAVAGETRGVTKPANGAALVGGIGGNVSSLETYVGVSFVDSTNRCKLFDSDNVVTPPANTLTDFTGMPQPHISFAADMSDNFVAGFLLQSGHATNTATVEIDDYDVSNSVTLVDNPPVGAENLVHLSDFESEFTGRPKDSSLNHDGWLQQTMRVVCDDAGVACPDPASTPRCYTTQSCGSHTHAYSDAVVASDGSVNPRAGSYFLRMETREADYPIGDPPGTTGERSNYKIGSDLPSAFAKYNTTTWIGYSMYFPSAYTNPNYREITVQCSIYPEVGNIIALIQSYNPDTTKINQIAYQWDAAGERTKIPNGTQWGGANPIPMYFDEWVDFKLEIKPHITNGAFKLWHRRASDPSYTQYINYTGPIGAPDGHDLRCSMSIYGGGFVNSPNKLVLYYDEWRMTNETVGGTSTDVEPP